jgi:hypothetical protein
VVLGNRDHAERRHAVLWEVMDDAPAAHRRDWNEAVFALYAGREQEAEQRWRELEAKRLQDTRPALPLPAYAGRFDSPALGELSLEASEGALRLRTALLDQSLSHWHLDTFLLDYPPWQLREFLQYRIGPDGAVESFTLFGETFTRIPDSGGG